MTFYQNPDHSQFDVIARPCAERETRIFYRQERHRAEPTGVCYRAYSLALGRDRTTRDYVILVEHGGGQEALALHNVFGFEADWLLTITDERRLYAALWTLYKTASDVSRAVRSETVGEYSRAFVEGRLKKSRKKQGYVRVTIEPRAAASADAA
ncbi:hypothetical protein PUR29_32975 [Methylobacterium ajmalii]|uniref:Uncharacterized protein n=1 Tax=Methylobacterium ajmalii TaxID=2738439 RepID=A0ABV0A358_9HYPH